jgi:hypothetical protein
MPTTFGTLKGPSSLDSLLAHEIKGIRVLATKMNLTKGLHIVLGFMTNSPLNS